jgi:hypothetical protein
MRWTPNPDMHREQLPPDAATHGHACTVIQQPQLCSLYTLSFASTASTQFTCPGCLNVCPTATPSTERPTSQEDEDMEVAGQADERGEAEDSVSALEDEAVDKADTSSDREVVRCAGPKETGKGERRWLQRSQAGWATAHTLRSLSNSYATMPLNGPIATLAAIQLAGIPTSVVVGHQHKMRQRPFPFASTHEGLHTRLSTRGVRTPTHAQYRAPRRAAAGHLPALAPCNVRGWACELLSVAANRASTPWSSEGKLLRAAGAFPTTVSRKQRSQCLAFCWP